MRIVVASIASVLVLAAGPARAAGPSRADTEACLEAHISGQRMLKEGKVKDAAAELERCASDSCPKVVRRDCRKMVEDAKSKVPSVMLDVSDHTGAPVTDATIVIDGKATELKSGQTVELNPGKHWARVIGKNGRSVEVTFDLEEGQKSVRVKAALPAPPEPATEKPADEAAPIPVATWIGGGVALVGLIGFSVFALSGSSKESDLDACAPRCDDRSVYEDMKRDYLIADVSLLVSVVAAGVGAYFYFTKDDAKKEREPVVAWGRVRALGAGAGVDLGVDF